MEVSKKSKTAVFNRVLLSDSGNSIIGKCIYFI